MSNTSINLVSLDFDKIKENLKQYLQRSNSPFKDYLYDGSNIASLIDLLSYNSYLNGFYVNMIGSEMFLDSAQLRDSIVSHAKELGYVPRSFRSAVATVSFTVTPASPLGGIIVPKGTSFTSKVGSNTFSFTVNETVSIVANTDGKFYANLEIYEGIFTSDSFSINSANTTQRFVLSNPTIDTRSLTVTVVENNGANIKSYSKASSFLGLTSNSEVYFLQAAENNQYEILFGDGIVSKRPTNGSTIIAEYRVCNGQLPNGASSFTIDGPIQGQSNISTVVTLSEATGGDTNEDIEAIRFNAPRHYQNQERAITTSDYESILKSNFPEITAAAAFGGDELEPPVFGKVYVSIDIKNSDGVSEIVKKRYYDFLKQRSPVSIDPVIIDPEFTYLDVYSKVRYNINRTSLKPSDIKSIVSSRISQFNTENLSDFKKTFRYSKLINTVDNAHLSIISNDTYVRPYKIIAPNENTPLDFVVEFGIKLSNFNNITSAHLAEETSSITSSNFTYNNKLCSIQDDGEGNLNIVSHVNNIDTVVARIGVVNYQIGRLDIRQFAASYTGPNIRIYVDTVDKDIIANKNNILTINDNDILVDVEQVRE